MIEIIWKNEDIDEYVALQHATNLFSWLVTAIVNLNKEHVEIVLSGYMLVKDRENKCTGLIICGDPVSQRKVLNILQQPPEEYKNKYIACVPCNEPDPVHEETEKDSKENNIKISEET